jgi:predicted porin
MQRTLIAVALSTLFVGSAFAQSSITVYGRLNVSVEAQKDGDVSNTLLVDNSSRIGFKGVEDLGGGLKAGFLIESGFDATTGAASSTFWGRESNVYLEGGFGKVRLGNMGPTAAYFATADYISMHNHDTGTSSDAFYLYPGDARNTIAYTSPSFSGFVVDLQYGLKEAGDKDTITLAANYDAGPLHIGAAYLDGSSGAAGVDAKEFGLRALYEFGAFTVGAYYVQNTLDDGVDEAKRDAFRLSAMYAMGASEFHINVGSAGKVKVNGASQAGTDATQWTLGYNYNLSKRTKLYGFYTTVDNNANSAYYSSANGADFQSFAVGIRHNF